MKSLKTKSLIDIEQKMEGIDKDSLRYHLLESAKNFKASWLKLGGALYSVWKGKLYKDWGYATLEAYTSREIGIRKLTAMKLLRSYYFLEKEEPEYLKEEYLGSAQAKAVPSYESVDLLRLAKNKKGLDREDYASIKNEVLVNGKDHREVRKGLSEIIRQRQELEPEEAAKVKKVTTLRRLIGTLKALKREAEVLKILPAPLIKETADLIRRLESELEEK